MSERVASNESPWNWSIPWLSSIGQAAVELEQAFSAYCRRHPTRSFILNVGLYVLLCLLSHAMVGIIFGPDAIQNAAGIWFPNGFSVYLRWRVGSIAYPVVFFGEMMSGAEIGFPFNTLMLAIIFGAADVSKLWVIRFYLPKDKVDFESLVVISIVPSIASGVLAIGACRFWGHMVDIPFGENLLRWVVGDLIGLIVGAAVISKVATGRRSLLEAEYEQLWPILFSNSPSDYRDLLKNSDIVGNIVTEVLNSAQVDSLEPLDSHSLHELCKELQQDVDEMLYDRILKDGLVDPHRPLRRPKRRSSK